MFKGLKYETTTFLVCTIFIIYMAGASIISQNDFIYTAFFSLLFFIFLIQKKEINLNIILVYFTWIIINLFSYFVNDGLSFNVTTFFGVSLKIILPYFMVKLVGPRFFDYIVKYIYVLAIIVFPFYIIDFLFPGFTNNISQYLNFITQDEQASQGGWYIFVYMHSAWAYLTSEQTIYRNCGFMWEPGAYAMILIFALIYHLGRNGFTLDKYTLVFVISILTTLSTSGYLALFMVFGAYYTLFGKNNTLIFFLFLPVVIYVGFVVYELDFISGKINDYNEDIDNSYTHFSGIERVNRFAILKYNFEQTLSWPLGNGVLDSLYLKKKYGTIYRGPNTFANVIYMWGFVGGFLLLYYLYKLYAVLFDKPGLVTLYLTIALCMVLFTSGLEVRPLIYAMVYYYFEFGRKIKNHPSQETLVFHSTRELV